MAASFPQSVPRDRGVRPIRGRRSDVDWDVLARRRYDVLIIGGGIVGAGVARDAAMRGLSVLLLEQRYLASGTSSRSSRLLHGGLRYLAQGHLGLVREASVEKKVLQQIAPHLVQPLPFLFPTRDRGPWRRWKLSVGVKLYDWLCRGGNYAPSGTMGRDEILSHLPSLHPGGLTGAARYYDALTQDARLVMDTCRSAAAHGAVVLNYAPVQSLRRSSGGWVAQVTDRLAARPVEFETRTVVNAAGPWADRWPASGCPLRLTKGVHLVVDRDRLPVSEAVVLAEGRRILFVIPWGQRVILGTTDTDYQGDLEEPPCTAEDAGYILDVVNRAFAKAGLGAGDVQSTWAGLRPLLRDRGGGPSDISRRHRISMTQPGWFDVTGGKLTTYRLMAEQTVDRIVRFLGAEARPCRTACVPLIEAVVGAVGEMGVIPISGVLPPEPSSQLVRHYCDHEWAVHLEDVMLRRTSWKHYRCDHASLAHQVAVWMGECLGWDARRQGEELREYENRSEKWKVKSEE